MPVAGVARFKLCLGRTLNSWSGWMRGGEHRESMLWLGILLRLRAWWDYMPRLGMVLLSNGVLFLAVCHRRLGQRPTFDIL